MKVSGHHPEWTEAGFHGEVDSSLSVIEGADFKIIGNSSTCFVTVLNKGGVTVFRPKGPAIQIARAIGPGDPITN